MPMKRIISMLLCVLIVVCTLPGCDAIRTPEMALVGEYPYELPLITNSSWCEAANSAISAKLEPLLDVLRQANSEHTVACTHYEFVPHDDDTYSLEVFIKGTKSDGSCGTIRLAEFYIEADGIVYAPDIYLPDYLYDSDLLDGCLRLSGYGFELSGIMSDTSYWTTEKTCHYIIDYYEFMTGNEVDTSRVRLESDDEYYLKSVAMGLCSDEYSYYDTYFTVTITQFNQMLSKLMTYVYTDYLGRSSEFITPDALTDAIDLYMKLYFASPNENSPREIVASESDLSVLFDLDYVVRDDIAVVFNEIYKHNFGELSITGEYTPFDDYASEAAETAYYMGFIGCFPSYGLFNGDFPPREYQLFDLIDYYVSTCYWRNFTSANPEPSVDGSAFIRIFGWVDRYFDSFSPPRQKAVIVDNSRDYPWYFAQFSTGEYSAVNCMPSITAMGIKWYASDSDVSVEEIRELWLPEYDSGWYMAQVADSLEYYDVPFEWHDMSEDMTEQLDQGRIILAQMSEAAYDQSGHCFVIYGYRRLGNSIQYMIHDPGIYEGLDEFGKPPGEAMLLDGIYTQWIIERMTYSFITIG